MILILPVALFLGSALALVVMRLLRSNFAYAWMIAALTALVNWVLVLFLRIRLVQTFTLGTWQPIPSFGVSLTFILDRVSWVYVACLATLVLAVILTASVHSHVRQDNFAWAESLMLGGLGLLAVMAGSPVVLVSVWTALDLVELGIILGSISTRELSRRAIIAFSARTLGSLCVVWGSLQAVSSPEQGYSVVTASSGLFFLLGAGLRLGVFPLHLPYASEPGLRRGVGSLLRLVPAASSLMLLARVPADTIPAPWVPILLIAAVFAALYTALMWITAPNEIEGRPYWIIGMAALAVGCTLRGYPQGVLAWSTALLLAGGLLFLYSAHNKWMNWFWGVALFSITGLPFTATASGWAGLVSAPPLPGLGLLFLLAYILLLLGYARHSLRVSSPGTIVEPWARAIYPLGLLVIPLTLIVMGLFGWIGSRVVGVWWAGAFTALCLLAITLVRVTQPARYQNVVNNPLVGWVNPLLHGLLLGVSVLFRLDWLYRVIWFFLDLLGRLLRLLSGIFEGDAGVLWAILLLTLVMTFLQRSGRP